MLYCTYRYIHIMSAYETTETGYEARGSCPDGGFWGRAERPPGPMPEWLGYYRPIKKAVTLRLDADILAWRMVPRQGRGYQTGINRALRKLMSEERKISGGEPGGNVPSGTCEKIDSRRFAGDSKCIPTSQTPFIDVLRERFADAEPPRITNLHFFMFLSPGFLSATLSAVREATRPTRLSNKPEWGLYPNFFRSRAALLSPFAAAFLSQLLASRLFLRTPSPRK